MLYVFSGSVKKDNTLNTKNNTFNMKDNTFNTKITPFRGVRGKKADKAKKCICENKAENACESAFYFFATNLTCGKI